MNEYAVVVRHSTKPGMRDEVQRVWQRHMQPAVAANPGHAVYVYTFGADPDQIVAFQVYASADAASAFLRSPAYVAYETEVADLLDGPPQVEVLQPQWIKPPAPPRLAVEAVPVDAIRSYRLQWLRRGTADENVVFAGDDDAETVHLLARASDGTPAGVSSWMQATSPDRPGEPALQLRGMATDPQRRRQGVGRALVEAGVALAAERGLTWVWANARDSALDFYRSAGFEVVGDGFVTADTQLPHHRILRRTAPVGDGDQPATR